MTPEVCPIFIGERTLAGAVERWDKPDRCLGTCRAIAHEQEGRIASSSCLLPIADDVRDLTRRPVVRLFTRLDLKDGAEWGCPSGKFDVDHVCVTLDCQGFVIWILENIEGKLDCIRVLERDATDGVGTSDSRTLRGE